MTKPAPEYYKCLDGKKIAVLPLKLCCMCGGVQPCNEQYGRKFFCVSCSDALLVKLCGRGRIEE